MTNGYTYTGILVDTCFLISLVNKGDPLHANAEAYFRWALAEKIPLYMSAITLSEFQQKQELGILENFKILIFGLSEIAAQHKHFSRDDVSGLPSDQKVLVKDDIKILATCLAHEIDTVLSSDGDLGTLAKSKGLKVIDFKTPISEHLGELPLEGN